jgi:hypothetical protein
LVSAMLAAAARAFACRSACCTEARWAIGVSGPTRGRIHPDSLAGLGNGR